MGRPKDEEAWEQVTRHENGTWTCKRCGRNFSKGTSITRIRAHLGSEKGKGIALCEGSSVPSNQGGNSTAAMAMAMAMAASSDPMELVDGMHSFQVARQARHTFDDSIPSSCNYQNAITACTLCEGEARQAHHTINNSIPYSSNNHQNVPPANNLFEVTTYGDHAIDGNLTNSSSHQNVPSANNLFEAGGVAHEVDTGLPIHTSQSQGLPSADDAVGNDHGGLEDEISQVKALVDMLTREEGNIDTELQWLESRTGHKRRREADDINDWLEGVDELKERAHAIRIELLSAQGWSTGRSALQEEIKKLREDVHTHIEGKPFVLSSNEFMLGLNFYENLKELSYLVRHNGPLIGVHGMGGVGKTTLVTHFKNKKLREGDFKDVIWVTVSQDFSIFKLQSAIAKRINIKLDEDDEIVERAKILSLALDKKGKLLLILDDVWSYIDLQKVGIPLRAVKNGIKLILTSRLNHVFRQMDFPPQNIIQMEPLYPYSDDAWSLFLQKLGCYRTPATLTPEIEDIARSIVDRCDGLPLGISVMARIMKGVNDIGQWRHALYKLENSAMGGEMEDEVIKSLKLSYDHLMDKNIQNCFLVCALHGECSKAQLIMNLVDEGLIKEMKSLEEIFEEGHAILDQLKGHSLLEESLPMNGLVRDMASYVMKGRYIVKYDANLLRKVPDVQEWTPDLEKVSFIYNFMVEIPEGTSPRCPQLSTLIFRKNGFSQIPICFFSNMDSLTILDLSNNVELTSLPDSLCRLRSLKSLLLGECSSLKYVPPLWQLLKLTRLVISGTAIERVPEGLAMLVKLRWLDLSNNKKLTCVPWSVLLGLTNMKYLDLRSQQVTVKVENVKEIMSVLEYFACCFPLSEDFNDYMENIMDRGIGPKHCHLSFGIANTATYRKYDLTSDDYTKDQHYVHFRDGEAVNHLLPIDLLELGISYNKQWSGGICDTLPFKAPSSLRKINVEECPKLERLFCLTGSCSFCKHLHNLHSLNLSSLERLEVIWTEIGEGISLPNLSSLTIVRCSKMEKLLTPEALLQLPNLETIDVWSCESMKEIFARRGSGEGDDNNIDSTITLPNSFNKLVLWDLPQLKNVCASIIVSESPPTLQVHNCPKLIRSSVRHNSSHSDLNTVILW